MSQWFVITNEKEHGPFSSNDLKAMVKTGRLLKSDKIRRSDMQKCVNAGVVKGLFDAQPDPLTREGNPPLKKSSNFEEMDNRQEEPKANNKKSKGWTVKKLSILSGIFALSVLILGVVLGNLFGNQVKTKITEADKFYASGSKDKAAKIYSEIIDTKFEFIPKNEKPQILAKLIESILEKNDLKNAEKYIELAKTNEIELDSSITNDPRLAKKVFPNNIGKDTQGSDLNLASNNPLVPNINIPSIPDINLPSVPNINMPNSSSPNEAPVDQSVNKKNPEEKSGVNLPPNNTTNKEKKSPVATPQQKLDPNKPEEYVAAIGGKLKVLGQGTRGFNYDLDLSNLDLNYEIASELGRIGGVVKLNLSGTNFDSKGFVLLLTSSGNKPAIQELIISDYKKGKVPIIFDNDVAEALTQSVLSLRRVSLAGIVPQNEEGIKTLVNFATACTRLDFLDISNQPIDDQNLKNILISKKNLEVINVDNSKVSDQGIILLSRLLPGMMQTRDKRLEMISLINTTVTRNAADLFESKIIGCKVVLGTVNTDGIIGTGNKLQNNPNGLSSGKTLPSKQELLESSFEELVIKYGKPDDIYKKKTPPNVWIASWQISENKYFSVTYVDPVTNGKRLVLGAIVNHDGVSLGKLKFAVDNMKPSN